MSAAIDVLQTIQTAGISLRAEQGKIIARPASRLTPALRHEISAHKCDLLAVLIAGRHGLTMDVLQNAAGADWNECLLNPEVMEALASAVETRQMREKGIVPPSYTARTFCRGCNATVPIYPGVAKKVEGCPWCLNRHAGQPVPRVTSNLNKQENHHA